MDIFKGVMDKVASRKLAVPAAAGAAAATGLAYKVRAYIATAPAWSALGTAKATAARFSLGHDGAALAVASNVC